MTEKLDEMMSLDGTVVQVLPGGTFRRFPGSVYEPEFQMGTDDDGQILKVHDAAMIEEIAGQGWTVETGWSGQYSYSGPVMHESEYIGGSLADHILSTPGLWCALPVYVDSEECPNGSDTCKLSDPCVICHDGTGRDREQHCAGWVVMRKDRPAPKHVEMIPERHNKLRGTVSGPGDAELFPVDWQDGTHSVEQYATEGREWREIFA